MYIRNKIFALHLNYTKGKFGSYKEGNFMSESTF